MFPLKTLDLSFTSDLFEVITQFDASSCLSEAGLISSLIKNQMKSCWSSRWLKLKLSSCENEELLSNNSDKQVLMRGNEERGVVWANLFLFARPPSVNKPTQRLASGSAGGAQTHQALRTYNQQTSVQIYSPAHLGGGGGMRSLSDEDDDSSSCFRVRLTHVNVLWTGRSRLKVDHR